jgi:hypothetical protein
MGGEVKTLKVESVIIIFLFLFLILFLSPPKSKTREEEKEEDSNLLGSQLPVQSQNFPGILVDRARVGHALVEQEAIGHDHRRPLCLLE